VLEDRVGQGGELQDDATTVLLTWHGTG
jgi:hypothetical protein